MRRARRKICLAGMCLCVTSVIILSSSILDHDADDGRFRSPIFWNSIIKGYNQDTFIQVFKAKHEPWTIRKSILALGQKVHKRKEVWPYNETDDDRILAQINAKSFQVMKSKEHTKPALKRILVWSGLKGWGLPKGQHQFLSQGCNINSCELSSNKSDLGKADLILFQTAVRPWQPRPPGQIWMMFALEAPMRYADWSQMSGINWTATYRHDSTIVAPYQKFLPYSRIEDTKITEKNYASGKTKQVAWFVSNCHSHNGREEYAQELAKYINVDIYGACGKFKCPRGPNDEKECYSKLNKDYKFYLAFENANCRDYITEKFFVLGLQHNVLPIVMGAAPEDYRRAAPLHSYIHVEDFQSPRELAGFLHLLDKRDDLYNSYFAWKGTGTFINTYFWCRVCAMLNDDSRPVIQYHELRKWWAENNVCIGKSRWNSFYSESRVTKIKSFPKLQNSL